MNFIKRFFRLFRRRNYMMYTKPCPRCGGRRVYFDIDWGIDTNTHFRLVCDDCGFVCRGRSTSDLLDKWNAYPRKESEHNHV